MDWLSLCWAIELEIDYQHWRKIVRAKVDDTMERKRWIVMCHRLGSAMSKDIVSEQRGHKRKRLA